MGDLIPFPVLFVPRPLPVPISRRYLIQAKEENKLWLAALDADIAGLKAQDAGDDDRADCHFARADALRAIGEMCKVTHG